MFCLCFFITAFVRSHASAAQTFDWFWFVWERGSYVDSTYLVYRPFYLKNTYQNASFTAVLMPFIYWNYTTPRMDSSKGLLGFYSSVDYRSARHHENDTGIFPFLLYGSSTHPEDRYVHVWPLGGTIKGKLALDSITTYGFPGAALFILYPPSSYFAMIAYFAASLMPAYVQYTSNDYNAHGIVWPIIQWGKSGIRDDVRVMPFYAHSRKEGFYDTASYGMLFNVRREFIGKDTNNTIFFVPFYARRWLSSGKAQSSSLLWPFFSWGYNDKDGNLEINFPWPLVQIRDSKDPFVYKRIYFPFYGKYRTDNEKTFFITPLYFMLEKQNDAYQSSYTLYGILFWHFKRDYEQQHQRYGNRWRFFKLWPLFHYEYNDMGDSSFAVLSIFPFRDEEGYERLYQPLFSIVEYTRRSNGERRFGLMLRTYYQVWNDSSFTMKIPFLVTYSEVNNIVHRFAVLLSFFSYTNDDTVTEVRIAWVPVYKKVKNQTLYNEKKQASRMNSMKGGKNYQAGYAGAFTADDCVYRAPLFMTRF